MKAAILREARVPMTIEEVEHDGPRPQEVFASASRPAGCATRLSCHRQGEALAAGLIDDRQDAELAAIVRRPSTKS